MYVCVVYAHVCVCMSVVFCVCGCAHVCGVYMHESVHACTCVCLCVCTCAHQTSLHKVGVTTKLCAYTGTLYHPGGFSPFCWLQLVAHMQEKVLTPGPPSLCPALAESPGVRHWQCSLGKESTEHMKASDTVTSSDHRCPTSHLLDFLPFLKPCW